MMLSSTTADLESQVKLLTEELAQSQAKLIQWKEKAKIGVDELRARVVSLTEDLTVSEKKRVQLEALVGTATSTTGVPAALAEREVRHALETASLYATALEGVSTSAWEYLGKSSTLEEYETYKRRTTMTLRLQTKNCESLQEQVSELTDKLQRLRGDLHSSEVAVRTRDEALATLSARLEAAESARQALEKQQASFLQGPNMEQVNRMDEQRERDLQRVRDEFMERESTLLAQHSDELTRLVSRYEEELQLTREEGEERAARALEQLRVLQLRQADSAAASASATRRDGAAYEELLNQQQKLEKEKLGLAEKVDRLMKEVQVLKSKERAPNHSTSEDAKKTENPQTLEEAKQIIFQKRQALVSMTEELWSVKKELMTLKQGASTTILPADALDGQQVAYLRSILLNLFSKYGDISVFMHTLPVIAMLLHIEPDELSPLYRKHPTFFQAK
ncbi:hypothetical protein STCU_07288 [Strigomonas culicis]|uniref:GRIP domain-containing protein n=1 Tax=Strigomonas culicis TaxID=28005 RepID=S9U0F1_9TRYP|nr:hypothetical protein STCU_07288 [Strigomonas culicis]|eukprot:EPY24222.1 hypothetical protein STCU_07288 [Strigomonas culicis]